MRIKIQLTLEWESLLVQLATHKGQAADTLAAEVICHYLDEEAGFIEAVRQGETELERGEYFISEEVSARLERLFSC